MIIINLENKVFDFLGKISFGLYVYNPLVIYLMAFIINPFEIENALFKNKLIAKHNYGDLSKIAFSRATRTDKSVHALQNCFSCKI